MVRFLSAAWFELLEDTAPPAPPSRAELVLEQVVTGAPDGEVRYQVLISEAGTTVTARRARPADMTFTSDYQTAAAIAQGRQSVQSALMEGRIRVGGNPGCLATYQERLHRADPVPESVRRQTIYEADA